MAVQKLFTRVLIPGGAAVAIPYSFSVYADEGCTNETKINNQSEHADESKPAVESKPIDGAKSVDDTKHADETKPSRTGFETKPVSQIFLSPQDLPIYDGQVSEDMCTDCQDNAAPEDPSQLQQGVTKVRKTVMSGVDNLKIEENRDKFLQNLDYGLTRIRNAYEHLSREENYLSRAAAISSGGLLGLISARRGGIIKRVIYASTGLATAASICYPKQAVIISEDLFKIGKYYALIAYQKAQEAGTDMSLPSFHATTIDKWRKRESEKQKQLEWARTVGVPLQPPPLKALLDEQFAGLKIFEDEDHVEIQDENEKGKYPKVDKEKTKPTDKKLMSSDTPRKIGAKEQSLLDLLKDDERLKSPTKKEQHENVIKPKTKRTNTEKEKIKSVKKDDKPYVPYGRTPLSQIDRNFDKKNKKKFRDQENKLSKKIDDTNILPKVSASDVIIENVSEEESSNSNEQEGSEPSSNVWNVQAQSDTGLEIGKKYKLTDQSQNQSDVDNQSQNQSDVNNQSQNQYDVNNQSQNQYVVNNQSQNQYDVNNQSQNLYDVNNQSQNLYDVNNQSQNQYDVNNQSQNQYNTNAQQNAAMDYQSDYVHGNTDLNIWTLQTENMNLNLQGPAPDPETNVGQYSVNVTEQDTEVSVRKKHFVPAGAKVYQTSAPYSRRYATPYSASYTVPATRYATADLESEELQPSTAPAKVGKKHIKPGSITVKRNQHYLAGDETGISATSPKRPVIGKETPSGKKAKPGPAKSPSATSVKSSPSATSVKSSSSGVKQSDARKSSSNIKQSTNRAPSPVRTPSPVRAPSPVRTPSLSRKESEDLRRGDMGSSFFSTFTAPDETKKYFISHKKTVKKDDDDDTPAASHFEALYKLKDKLHSKKDDSDTEEEKSTSHFGHLTGWMKKKEDSDEDEKEKPHSHSHLDPVYKLKDMLMLKKDYDYGDDEEEEEKPAKHGHMQHLFKLKDKIMTKKEGDEEEKVAGHSHLDPVYKLKDRIFTKKEGADEDEEKVAGHSHLDPVYKLKDRIFTKKEGAEDEEKVAGHSHLDPVYKLKDRMFTKKEGADEDEEKVAGHSHLDPVYKLKDRIFMKKEGEEEEKPAGHSHFEHVYSWKDKIMTRREEADEDKSAGHSHFDHIYRWKEKIMTRKEEGDEEAGQSHFGHIRKLKDKILSRKEGDEEEDKPAKHSHFEPMYKLKNKILSRKEEDEEVEKPIKHSHFEPLYRLKDRIIKRKDDTKDDTEEREAGVCNFPSLCKLKEKVIGREQKETSEPTRQLAIHMDDMEEVPVCEQLTEEEYYAREEQRLAEDFGLNEIPRDSMMINTPITTRRKVPGEIPKRVLVPRRLPKEFEGTSDDDMGLWDLPENSEVKEEERRKFHQFIENIKQNRQPCDASGTDKKMWTAPANEQVLQTKAASIPPTEVQAKGQTQSDTDKYVEYDYYDDYDGLELDDYDYIVITDSRGEILKPIRKKGDKCR